MSLYGHNCAALNDLKRAEARLAELERIADLAHEAGQDTYDECNEHLWELVRAVRKEPRATHRPE